jgi:hypothetical protein
MEGYLAGQGLRRSFGTPMCLTHFGATKLYDLAFLPNRWLRLWGIEKKNAIEEETP